MTHGLRATRDTQNPEWLETEMIFNQAIACAFGMVPILGDLAVAIFGCNARNVALLEEYLAVRGAEYLKPGRERRYKSEDIKPGAGMEPGETPLSHYLTTTSSDPTKVPLIQRKDLEA